MKFLLASTPLVGHVNPVLNVGRILASAGHEVVFTCAPEYRAAAEACGLKFATAPVGAAEDMSDIDASFPERKSIPPGPQQILFDVKKLFCDPVEARYKGLLSILETFPADAILVDCLYSGTLPFLLNREAKRPAIAHLGIAAFMYHRDDFAPFGPGFPPVEPDSPEAQRYKSVADAMSAELWSPAKTYMNEILRKLGADPLPMSYLDSVIALPDVYMQPGSPSVEIPRKDLPESVHCIGVLPSFTKGALPESAAKLVHTGKKLVVVTQGTLSNIDLTQLLEPALAAFAGREDLVVVATTGGRSLSVLQSEVPENAAVLQYLPLDELMKYASVLVTNGGYGTVSRSFALGVPMVVAGKSEDKAEVAMHVANAGIGINLQTDRATPAAIREAVDAILTTDTYRRRSRAVAAELAGIDAVENILRLMEEAVLAKRRPVYANA
jgi:UDP:flavonoid glycosyltransferase YjiC (YdhE family)